MSGPESEAMMPSDAEKRQLAREFSKPSWETEDLQAFELKFEDGTHAYHWQQLAYSHARRLEIPIEFHTLRDSFTICRERNSTGKSSGIHSFLIGVKNEENFTQLCDAIAPDFQEYIKSSKKALQRQMDHMFTCDGYKDLFNSSEEYATVRTLYWKKRNVTEPPRPVEEKPERTLTPSQQYLIDKYSKEFDQAL